MWNKPRISPDPESGIPPESRPRSVRERADGKPAAIASASSGPRGGARAPLHVRQILVDPNVYPINQPQLLLARAQDSFDSNLKLNDLQARETLKNVLQTLVSWA